jgi:DNA-directed RNA polymerase specialized sigma24 family protein
LSLIAHADHQAVGWRAPVAVPRGERLRLAFAHARALLVDRGASAADAEDSAQEALLLAWQSGVFAGAADAALSFVGRAALAQLREGQRRQRETPAGLLKRGRPFPTPHEVVMSSTAQRLVQIGLARLSRLHRTAILLFDVEGLTANQAAHVLGIRLHTFYSRLRNGRSLLGIILRRVDAVERPGAVTEAIGDPTALILFEPGSGGAPHRAPAGQ